MEYSKEAFDRLVEKNKQLKIIKIIDVELIPKYNNLFSISFISFLLIKYDRIIIKGIAKLWEVAAFVGEDERITLNL